MSLTGPADSAERAWLDLGLRSRAPTDQSLMHTGLAFLYQTRGRLAEADRQMLADNGLSEQRGLPGGVVATDALRARQLVLFKHDTAGATLLLQRALDRHPLSSLPTLDRPYAELATTWLMLGQAAPARKLLTEYESTVPEGQRRVNPEWYRARGWQALAEGRPDDAIIQFKKMATDGQRVDWGHWELGLAYERANQPDSARSQYEIAAAAAGNGYKTVENSWSKAPSLKRLGELYEARGDRTRAIDNYSRLVDLWQDADPVLQPTVREIKERLVKLTGEPKQ
jgi:tetratricopeptide (TPR) repeat protein